MARTFRKRPRGHDPSSDERVFVYGFHAARAALSSPRRVIVRAMATAAAASKLEPEFAQSGVAPEIVTPDLLSARLGPNAAHQGVLLEARPLAPATLDDFEDAGFLLALDQITDPHNVGAILRTAAAFGLDGVVTTERHAPGQSGVLAKAASGALDVVPLANVVNLARALDELGQRGYCRIGLDSEGGERFDKLALARPLILVLGAEGRGLRRLTRERCDFLARLDLPGPIKSLNVSNACAVALALAAPQVGPQG